MKHTFGIGKPDGNAIAIHKASKYSAVFKSRITRSVIRIFVYILLFDISFVYLYPFLYMLVTSVKTIEDLNNISIKWIPSIMNVKNYVFAFQSLNYLVTAKNSIVLALVTTVAHIISCSFIAYGFARYKFPGKKILFVLVLLTIVVPLQTIIVPQYIVFVKLGWVGTTTPIIIPTLFGFGLKGGLFVFIYRQFFRNLPKELEEAAKIDGCGPIKTYLRIILPTSKAVILVTGTLSLVWHWNDYFEPNLYINRTKDFLLPQMLPSIYTMMLQVQSAASSEMMYLKQMYSQAVIMAATVLTILPIVLIYLFIQGQFMEGIEKTGIVE